MLVLGQRALPSVELQWTSSECPSQGAIIRSLEVLELELSSHEAEVTVRSEEIEEGLQLTIEGQGRRIERVVPMEGSCQERAAVVAAIIERVIRSVVLEPTSTPPSPQPTDPTDVVEGEPPAELEPSPPAPTAAPQEPSSSSPAPVAPGPPLPPEAPAEPSSDPRATADDDYPSLENRDPIWLLSGSLVVLGGLGPTVRGGADAEVRYEVTDGTFAVLRLSYRTPRIASVGRAEVRMDDGALAVGLQVGAPWDALALQATMLVQVVWAHASGLARDYSEVRGNPGFAVGACYQKDFGGWGLEACARGFGFLRTQEIVVNHAMVLGLPKVGGELALGVVYQF